MNMYVWHGPAGGGGRGGRGWRFGGGPPVVAPWSPWASAEAAGDGGPPGEFLVYWRERGRPQLLSFRQRLTAPTAHEARRWFRACSPGAVVVGVKAAAPGGRRVAGRGRWVG